MKSTQSKTATFVKKLEGMRGEAAIYRLDPPVKHSDYGEDERELEFVTVSAVSLPVMMAGYRDSETMVFPSDGEKTTDWGELAMVPHKSHADALADLGYTIA